MNLVRHGSIPVLKHGDLTIPDSAAICEYVAELAPEVGLWPDDRSTRAMARSVVADIHSFSGAHWSAVEFVSVGAFMPTNIRRRTGPLDIPANIQKIFDRSTGIWRECRTKYGTEGPYLFGQFSIADAMSAPLVNRFRDLQRAPRRYRIRISRYLARPSIYQGIYCARGE